MELSTSASLCPDISSGNLSLHLDRLYATLRISPACASLANSELADIVVFFREVFSVQRLINLVSYVTGVDVLGTDVQAGQRAAVLALEESAPEDFKLFFRSFGQLHRGVQYDPSAYQILLVNWDLCVLYESYLRCQKLLEEHGLGLADIILDYLAKCLKLKPTQLQNVLQHGQCVHLLVSTFGLGIIALIPSHAPNVLSRFGNEKLAAVVPIIRRALGDDAASVCRLAPIHLPDLALRRAKRVRLYAEGWTAEGALCHSLEELECSLTRTWLNTYLQHN